MERSFTIVERPEIEVIGSKTAVHIGNIHAETIALWDKFVTGPYPELLENKCVPVYPDYYGVSQFIDKEHYLYWTSVERDCEKDVPEGLSLYTIPAGTYVKSHVPHVSELGDIFLSLDHWLLSNNKYIYAPEVIAIEQYPYNWNVNDSFDIYILVVKNKTAE